VENQELKEQLVGACYGQTQLKDSINSIVLFVVYLF